MIDSVVLSLCLFGLVLERRLHPSGWGSWNRRSAWVSMTTTVRCEGTGEFSLHPISLHPSSKVCLQFAVILMNLHICFLSAEDALKQKSLLENLKTEALTFDLLSRWEFCCCCCLFLRHLFAYFLHPLPALVIYMCMVPFPPWISWPFGWQKWGKTWLLSFSRTLLAPGALHARATSA